jgi:hypothetical protein
MKAVSGERTSVVQEGSTFLIKGTMYSRPSRRTKDLLDMRDDGGSNPDEKRGDGFAYRPIWLADPLQKIANDWLNFGVTGFDDTLHRI